MQCLSETDRELEAIVHIAPLLKAGIGVHHSGLLPIVKELTELLFQEGLIKVSSQPCNIHVFHINRASAFPAGQSVLP